MLSKITDNTTDELLFEKIQAGDVKAFDILFMRYYPVLCAYAKQFVGFDDGQEIVQDVMVWFWENSSMQVSSLPLKVICLKLSRTDVSP